jgi:cell division protein FtsQ
MSWGFFKKGRSRNVRGNRRVHMLETKFRTRSDLSRRTRRLLWGWCVLLTLAVIGWGTWKLAKVGGRGMFSTNPQFVLRSVAVENTGSILSRDEILKHARIRKGQNLFEIDLKSVRTNLEILPEVKRVEIRRQIPDRMTIRVVERIAKARLAAQRGLQWDTYAVDGEGFVMSSSTGDSLPMITGVKVSDLRIGSAVSSAEIFHAIELLERCEATTLNALLEVESIDVSRSHMLVVRTADGMRLKIGIEFMEQNLRRLEFILNDARTRGLRVATADLTVDRDVPVVFRRAA